MGTLKTLGGRLHMAVLLPMALSLFALVGCGDTPAPYTAVMTVELYRTIPGTTNAGVNTKVYRVTMKDAAGVPMNGLKVNLFGTFSAGDNINLEGAVGTVPVAGVASLNSSIELNGSGIQDFFLTAPTTTTATVPTPVISGLASVPGSGSLVDGVYRYAVTALDANLPTPGETARSTTSQITLATGGTVTNNAIQVTWSPVNGASRYNVYRCAVAACVPGTLVATVPTTATTYLDSTGSGSGVATLGFGTSGIAVNTVTGTIDIQSGSLFQLLDVSLP